MHGFKKHSIRPWQEPKNWIKKHILLSIVIVLLGLLTLKGVVGAIQVGDPFSIKQIAISAVSEPIKTDSNNHTNILLIGVGGENHDGGHLTDTMILASIDYKNNLVPMLSIPRDLYVENEAVGWGSRINSVYEYAAENNDMNFAIGMKELIKEVENVTDMEVHYYAKIDFQGFTDIINALGGVEVTLEYDFYDPYYPASAGAGYLYEPFYLTEGTHELDGETALKYARSRQTTSDFDRAARQQEILNALKEKATSLGFLLNPVKIKNMLEAVSANFETNLSFSEMMNFASLASDFGSDSILSAVLHDDPSRTGGILYSPPKEEYGGAFVLTTYTKDFSEVHRLANLILQNPEIYRQQTPIQILNGTGTSGLAGFTALHLIRLGFNVVDASNAASKEVKESSMFIQTKVDPETGAEIKTSHGAEETMDFLTHFIPVKTSNELPTTYDSTVWDSEGGEVIIELGEDFLEFYEEYSQFFYIGYYYGVEEETNSDSETTTEADSEVTTEPTTEDAS
jgi:LCP family protein required for cell wall assembly